MWNFRCSAKGAVLCSSFKMYAALILFSLLFCFATICSKRICKSHFFLKFQVLRERTIVFASFPEHSVYSKFEMFSVAILGFLFWFHLLEHPLYGNLEMFGVLILGFLCWFTATYPKSMCKSNLFFVILGAPQRKKHYCVFRGVPCIERF